MFLKDSSVYPVEYECIKKELTSGERTSLKSCGSTEWRQKKMDEERERSGVGLSKIRRTGKVGEGWEVVFKNYTRAVISAGSWDKGR